MTKHFIQVFNYWLALLCCSGLLSGQSDILDQYISQALANNLSLKTHSFAEAKQLSRVEQAKVLWKPKVDLSTSYLLAEGGRTIVFPVGDLFNPVYGTLNELTSSQSFPTGLENNEIQLTPNNFLDANLTISKPLINSAIKHNLFIQEALVSLAGIDRSQDEKEVVFQVKQTYFNYIRTLKGEEVLTENIKLLREVHDFNEKLIRHDRATPDIQSDVEFQITNLEDQVIAIIEQRNITRHLFNTLLNRDINSEIEVDEDFMNNVPTSNYDLPEITQKALAERPELKRITLSQEINDLNRKRISAEKHPTLGLRGGVGLQTEDFSFDEGGPLYTAGISLGWNIFDGGLRNKKIEELQIERDELELQNEVAKQQIALQVAQSFYAWRTRVSHLTAQEAAIRSATMSYQATLNRYKNDKALLIELLTAQNRLINSELNKLLAVIDIHISVAHLEKTIFN